MTPKYKINPDLPLKTCITITGDKEYCKNCTRKDGYWYADGVEIIQINSVWYTLDCPDIHFDHELKNYFVKKKGSMSNPPNIVMNGVVGFDKEKRELVFGAFTKNKYNNVHVVTVTNEHTAINSEVLYGSSYVEEIATGNWRKGIKDNVVKNAINHHNKAYNIEDFGYDNLLRTYNEKKHKFNINHAKIANLLKDTTFGIELEACAGNLPQHLLNRTGTCICKDGSLIDGNVYPPEYVTVPLKGAKGITNIVELSEYLLPRNLLNIKCSYHLHLGGFNTSRLFLVALHSLAYKIQGDVFKMFPVYKLKPEGVKDGKNYCKVLPKIFTQYNNVTDFTEYINDAYKKLYIYLSEDGNNRRIEPCKTYNRKNKAHLGGGYKWNKVARYHWLNMINSVFSRRNTLEFRLHTPTFNSTKIINWLLICNAICKYAEKYPMRCLDSTKVTFDEVLSYYQMTNSNNIFASFVSEYLKAYVAERTEVFKADKNKSDFTSEHELKTDREYTFTYNERQLLC